MHREMDGCAIFTVVMLFAIIGITFSIQLHKNNYENRKKYEEAQKNGINNIELMNICFTQQSYPSYDNLINFTLSDFNINQPPIYHNRKLIPYTFRNCIFQNMTIETNPLENVQFINCTFINTSFNNTFIKNTLFVNCTFEQSSFNNCIFGDDFQYYGLTIVSLDLNNNTYTPEHLENGINKFESLVETTQSKE